MTNDERTKVRVFAAVSLVMLAAAAGVRSAAPSPFAPRVQVRWNAGVEDEQRITLERRFSLMNGERRENDTWAYDLVELAPASVTALVAHPDVADTHYIDRTTGRIAADAPPGRVRLADRPFATLVQSVVFDWFLVFWGSSLVVSAVWLASDANARD